MFAILIHNNLSTNIQNVTLKYKVEYEFIYTNSQNILNKTFSLIRNFKKQ